MGGTPLMRAVRLATRFPVRLMTISLDVPSQGRRVRRTLRMAVDIEGAGAQSPRVPSSPSPSGGMRRAVPILATKLYIPTSRRRVVVRPRLVEWLNEGLAAGHRLTLVSAPAGFGKTTLVSEWSAGCGRPVAWLSLDDGDSDLGRFLAYLIAALQTVAPGIGEEVLTALQSPQPPPPEPTLTALLNDIAAIPRDCRACPRRLPHPRRQAGR